jgi:hypothetical protein
MAAVAVQRETVVWITEDEEVRATSWEDMATKIKAPAAKKNLTADGHKFRVLNRLGAEGWELVSHQRPDGPALRASESWTFKRKVTK